MEGYTSWPAISQRTVHSMQMAHWVLTMSSGKQILPEYFADGIKCDGKEN